MDELELLTEIERLRNKVKSLEAQVDLLQRILAEYISNPKPHETQISVNKYEN